MEDSIAAGEIVGLLYDAFAKQYADPESRRALHSLNVLYVRLVFCLYAEDAGIFGSGAMFHDYLSRKEMAFLCMIPSLEKSILSMEITYFG